MANDYNHHAAMQELRTAMSRTPRPLALIGAGVSISSGYPSWPELIIALADEAKAALQERGEGLPPKFQSILTNLHDPAWEAEEYARLLGPDKFSAFIRQGFALKNAVKEPHLAIARMGFRHYLTTNYDPCIEAALDIAGRAHQVLHWSDQVGVSDFLRDLSNFGAAVRVVYLHGYYRRTEDVIMTESSYSKRYIESEDTRRKLLAIFMTQPVVFIGFSLNDPDLAQFMREVVARVGTEAQHFALTPYETTDERDLINRRLMGKFGVRPIFYQTSRSSRGQDHSALLDIFADLDSRSVSTLPTSEVGRPATIESEDELPTAVDPNDPQKGRWGGRSFNGMRRLRVEIGNVNECASGHLMQFTLVLEPLANAPALSGNVIFHLHPTFGSGMTRVVMSTPQDARLSLIAYGAFTVGVVADDGSALELDLSVEMGFPQWFRES